MSEDKSKLQLIGEIAQANNKNLELIEELNDRENEIERLNNIIKEVREETKKLANLYDDNYTITDKAKDILEILDKEVNKQ